MISEELKNDLKIKWDRMRDGMAKMGMDACLLTVDVNLYYTTGQIYSGYFYLPVDGEDVYKRQGLNYLCKGYKKFFKHVAPYMDFMKKELLNQRPPANVMDWAKQQQHEY